MREPGIAGITSIECPSCSRRLRDYDAPTFLSGLVRVTARCHGCLTEQVLEIDHWRGGASVRAVSHVPWALPV